MNRIKPLEIIADICKQMGIMYLTDYLNKQTVRAIDAVRAVKQFTTADYKIVGDGDGSTSSFTIEKTPLSDVYNSFEIHYYKNTQSGEYGRMKYCNKDGKSALVSTGQDTKCSTSYTNYGFVRKFVIECPYIVLDATAAKLVDWLVDWFYLQKRISNFTTWLNAVDVQIGDTVTPYHPRKHPLENAIVTKIDHDLDSDEIHIRTIDHNPSDLIDNGGFETAGDGDPDFWADWTEDGSGDHANETTNVFAGSDACKLTNNAGDNSWVYQDITVVAETLYTLGFYTRGDGTYAGRYRIRDLTNAADIQAETNCLDGNGDAITGTTYTLSTKAFETPAACVSIRIFLASHATQANAVSYFDQVVLY